MTCLPSPSFLLDNIETCRATLEMLRRRRDQSATRRVADPGVGAEATGDWLRLEEAISKQATTLEDLSQLLSMAVSDVEGAAAGRPRWLLNAVGGGNKHKPVEVALPGSKVSIPASLGFLVEGGVGSGLPAVAAASRRLPPAAEDEQWGGSSGFDSGDGGGPPPAPAPVPGGGAAAASSVRPAAPAAAANGAVADAPAVGEVMQTLLAPPTPATDATPIPAVASAASAAASDAQLQAEDEGRSAAEAAAAAMAPADLRISAQAPDIRIKLAELADTLVEMERAQQGAALGPTERLYLSQLLESSRAVYTRFQLALAAAEDANSKGLPDLQQTATEHAAAVAAQEAGEAAVDSLLAARRKKRGGGAGAAPLAVGSATASPSPPASVAAADGQSQQQVVAVEGKLRDYGSKLRNILTQVRANGLSSMSAAELMVVPPQLPLPSAPAAAAAEPAPAAAVVATPVPPREAGSGPARGSAAAPAAVAQPVPPPNAFDAEVSASKAVAAAAAAAAAEPAVGLPAAPLPSTALPVPQPPPPSAEADAAHASTPAAAASAATVDQGAAEGGNQKQQWRNMLNRFNL